ncbi:MAG: hypothetical protein CSA22_07020 [Deltaproteobacteria bacterium]|nr:MAG: hypothetical protein CSA22_07020 [Deltaproteobacteria bacterium]
MVMKSQQGMTMIELMVTVAIVAVMVTAAAPSFNDWISSNRLKSSAREIRSMLEMARLSAVRERENVVVSFTTGLAENGTYVVFVDDGANDNVQDASETVLGSGSMPKRVTLASAAFNSNSYIRFNAMGLAPDLTSGSGQVGLTNDISQSLSVQVNLAGTSKIF